MELFNCLSPATHEIKNLTPKFQTKNHLFSFLIKEGGFSLKRIKKIKEEESRENKWKIGF